MNARSDEIDITPLVEYFKLLAEIERSADD